MPEGRRQAVAEPIVGEAERHDAPEAHARGAAQGVLRQEQQRRAEEGRRGRERVEQADPVRDLARVREGDAAFEAKRGERPVVDGRPVRRVRHGAIATDMIAQMPETKRIPGTRGSEMVEGSAWTTQIAPAATTGTAVSCRPRACDCGRRPGGGGVSPRSASASGASCGRSQPPRPRRAPGCGSSATMRAEAPPAPRRRALRRPPRWPRRRAARARP